MRPIHYITAAISIGVVAFTGNKAYNTEFRSNFPKAQGVKPEANRLSQPLSSLTNTDDSLKYEAKSFHHFQAGASRDDSWKMMLDMPEALVNEIQKAAIQEFLKIEPNSPEKEAARTKLMTMF